LGFILIEAVFGFIIDKNAVLIRFHFIVILTLRHSNSPMSFKSFSSTQLNHLLNALSNTRWFAPELLILSTLFVSLAFLSFETISIREANPEAVSLIAKAKAQTTVVVAQALQQSNQK
jgi:hypothetical protein